jgi:hypothetical protein
MRDALMHAVRDTFDALKAELCWRTLRARLLGCAEAILATVLAVCVSRYLGLTEIWWAAICAFSLTGLALKVALDMGVQQIAGTFAGTIIGLMLSPVASSSAAVFVLSMAGLSAAGLYLATKRSMGYMWILSTALAIFVVTTAHANPNVELHGVATSLWLNASIGTLVYLGIAVAGSAAALLHRKDKPSAPAVGPVMAHALTGGELGRVPHAMIGAIALSALAYLAWRYPLDGFPQAMTTALVVLMVPVDAQGTWSPYRVVQRMCHRLLGCGLGCVAVLAVLPLTAGSLAYSLIAVCVLVWLACYVRFGHSDMSYLGTQFGAVVILAFVHDSVWLSDSVTVAYHRLVGIVAGNVALTLVLLLVTLGSTLRFRRRAQ